MKIIRDTYKTSKRSLIYYYNCDTTAVVHTLCHYFGKHLIINFRQRKNEFVAILETLGVES